ncbi:MAG TPA: helix-turn-helix domain-containing protein [Acetobacteraceae bacterium]|nr:helix-turn-helix domain-containing protein [Acetobacteraceae bacterium]
MDLDRDPSPAEGLSPGASPASQTLVRGLDVLEQVADGPVALSAIARQLGLSRSTVHRLATTLLERRYLNVTPRRGYSLGPKLLELGSLARGQISLARLGRPYLETLAATTGDVAVLAVRDGENVLVADRVAGRRRVLPSLSAGDRLAAAGSALGAALAQDAAPVVVDDGGSEPEICVIAAPVRGADGGVRAALGIASASVYAGEAARAASIAAVTEAATAMSAELGWRVSAVHGEVTRGAARQLPELEQAVPADAHGRAGTSELLDERKRDRMGGPRR